MVPNHFVRDEILLNAYLTKTYFDDQQTDDSLCRRVGGRQMLSRR